MKKVLSLVLAILISVICFVPCFGISAEEETVFPETTSLFIRELINENPELQSDEKLMKKLQVSDAIYRGLKNLSSEVILYDLDVTYLEADGYNMVDECVDFVIQNAPDLFWLPNGIGYSTRYYSSSNRVYSIVLNYGKIGVDTQRVSAQIKEVENYVSGIVAKVPKDINDIGKLIWVHDYLDNNYEYITSGEVNHEIYSFFKEKHGVCDSYAKAYNVIMSRLGIAITNVDSDIGVHEWNMVRLNGENYHIDCTWDDPTSKTVEESTTDVYGRVRHNYFLISDSALVQKDTEGGNPNGHKEYYLPEEEFLGIDLTCPSKTFDQGYAWSKTSAQIVYNNGYFYFMNNQEYRNKVYNVEVDIFKTKDFTDNTFVTTVQSEIWWVDKKIGTYLPGFFSGFDIVGSQLYFNTFNSIRFYDLKTHESGRLNFGNSDTIHYSHYLGNGIFGYMLRDENGYYIKNTLQISNAGHIAQGSASSYASDLAALKKYFLNEDSTGLCLLNGDVTGDDSVLDIKDLIAIKKLATEN